MGLGIIGFKRGLRGGVWMGDGGCGWMGDGSDDVSDVMRPWHFMGLAFS